MLFLFTELLCAIGLVAEIVITFLDDAGRLTSRSHLSFTQLVLLCLPFVTTGVLAVYARGRKRWGVGLCIAATLFLMTGPTIHFDNWTNGDALLLGRGAAALCHLFLLAILGLVFGFLRIASVWRDFRPAARSRTLKRVGLCILGLLVLIACWSWWPENAPVGIPPTFTLDAREREASDKLKTQGWEIHQDADTQTISAFRSAFGAGSREVAKSEIQLLADLPNLRSVSIGMIEISEETLKAIAILTTLRELRLIHLSEPGHSADNKKLNGSALFDISKNSSIQKLHLDLPFFSATLTVNSIFGGRWPHLTDLTLSDSTLTDKGLDAFDQLTQLRSLDLTGCTLLTTKCVSPLSKLTGLTDLKLGDTPIEDDGVAVLCKKLPSLERLHLLVGTKGSHWDGLSSISRLHNLKELLINNERLDRIPIPPADFQKLRELSALRSLGLRHFQLSGEDLASLGALTQLESLNVEDCAESIRDADLTSLASLTQLRTLNLKGANKLTAGAVKRLRESIPSLTKVEWP